MDRIGDWIYCYIILKCRIYDVTSTNVYTDKITGNGDILNRELKLKGQNGIRANLGISFSVSIFTINADYNFSYFHSVAAGLIIGL